MNILSALSRSNFTVILTVVFACALTGVMLYIGKMNFLSSLQPYNPIWSSIETYSNLYTTGVLLLFALTMLEGRLVFKLVEHFGLVRFRTLLSFPIFTLLAMNNPSMYYISEGTFSLALFMLAVYLLFSSYQQQERAPQFAVLIGCIIGGLSLIWTKSLLYIPLFVIGLWFMRNLNLKTFLAFIIGVFSIYWMQFAYYFYNDNTLIFFHQFRSLYLFSLPSPGEFSNYEIIGFIVTVTIAVMASIMTLMGSFLEKVRTQASLNLIIWLIIFSAVLALFDSKAPSGHLAILYFATSILLTCIFSNKPTKYNSFMFVIITALYVALFVLQTIY